MKKNISVKNREKVGKSKPLGDLRIDFDLTGDFAMLSLGNKSVFLKKEALHSGVTKIPIG